ncbi:MAG: homocysteine S-methyltransferase family protein, partial [Myxococcota bacterium]
MRDGVSSYQSLAAPMIRRIAGERILVLDGGMGTMIQARGLEEKDYRGDLLPDHPGELKGNHDLLCLTRPGLISEIHEAYLAAGADILTTNTFNATALSQRDYGLEHLVPRINEAAARLAWEAARRWTERTPHKPRFVAGCVPPTGKAASISPDADRPSFREVYFEELVAAYRQQIRVLLEGGADLLLIETVFDTLNAKAAIFAASEEIESTGRQVPIWLSATIADRSGRTSSGQTPEAFWTSVRHAAPLAVGLNCAMGAEQLRPHLRDLSACADTLVSAHPNAGLPNESGGYDQTPESMSKTMGELAREGLLNMAGGCCGTSPEHIAAIADAVAGVAPRRVPGPPAGAAFSGLDALNVPEQGGLLVNVGERTNVAGSRSFARMIGAGRYEEAAAVAASQVGQGARVLDVNVDDPLIDSAAVMRELLLWFAADPRICRVPVMIDSSSFAVVEAGLKCLQGKCIVNSLSLAQGQDELRRRAR